MKERITDYSGVPTKQLSELMRRYGVLGPKVWAETHGLPEREVLVVYYKERPWTSLSVADKICLKLGGPHLLHSLPIIPAAGGAERMALDEFWVKGIEPTDEELSIRIWELQKFREECLS